MAAHFKEWPEKPENLVLEEKEKGQGSYGRVYIGKLAGNPVAVKVIYPNLLRAPGNDHLLLGFKEECAKLQSLKHDRIVKLLGTFWDKSLGPLLVMEVLDQNLEEFLRDHSKPGSLPLMQQFEIVKEVTEGLRYLHSHNIVHRDLKPANILIGKDGHLRIGDLGQSKLLNNLSDIMKTMQPGTPLYLPPEALKKGSAYTLKIDVFSLGVVTLCIATQAAPTTDIMNIGSVPEIIRRKEDLDRLEERHPLKGVISACLQDDPNLRPDVCFIDDHLGVLVANGRHVNKLEESLSGQRKELMDLNKLYNLQKKELADSKSKFKVQESKCQSHLQTIERQTREMKAQKQALYDEREAKQHQGEEMSQKVSNLEAKLKEKEVEMQRIRLLEKTFREETGKLKKELQTQEFECQSHLRTIERQRKELNVQKQVLDGEQKEKQLLQKEMSRRVSNFEAKLKMEHDTYERDVIGIEEILAIQQQKLDELSKLSTDTHDRNTLLEGEVHELRKRLNTSKSQLKSEIDRMKHTPNKQNVHQSEKEPFTQKAVDMKGNASGALHPSASTSHQNPNMGTRVDDTSVTEQTDTTISELILTGKKVCKRAISEVTFKEPDVVEIPLGRIHHRLVVKKGRFLYEDVDIKIAAMCTELGFTKGLSKDLNDQLKGQLQQTVDRRYQNGKPDKFDVFTVHCPPSTMGCRYLVVANILDRTIGSRQDHHKFLQQILHSVFKETDTLEMPSVAIVPATFAIGGIPQDSILPSFIRMFSQYQFTNDEFLTDVRFIAATTVEFGQLVAVAKRVSGTKLEVPVNVKTTGPEEQKQRNHHDQGSLFFSSLRSGWRSAVPVVTDLFSSETNSTQDQLKEISIPFQANQRLTLKMGNLVEEDIDAIVNPANGHLKHVCGVAAAINKASKGNVQRESDSLIGRRGGPISPGRVAVTAAGGKLHCKSIIHAVVPYAGQLSLEKYKEFLEEACKNTLSIAEQDKLSSIAFPPFISLLDKTSHRGPIAQIVIDVMLKYPYKQNSLLKDIRIVTSDVETLLPFQQYMQQVADSSPFISSTASTSPPLSTTPPSSTLLPSAAFPSSTHRQLSSPPTSSSIPTSKPEEVAIPFDKTHRKLIINKGHFLYEDADIKIAAICSEMGFTKGLNKDLNDQLKGQLQQTVDRRYQNGKPDRFDVFTVHCPPSTMGCRYLVVANILDRTIGSRQDHHKFLQQILHSVFKEADTLEMPSVAIVPATFAIGGFPQDSILPSFIRMFSQYQFTNDEFLTDVRFLATDDVELASFCSAAERTVGKVCSLKQKSNPLTLAPKLTSSPDQSPQYGSKVIKIPAVTVITGDIAEYAADAIVVPVAPSLDMRRPVPKAINSISKGAVFKYISRLKGKLSEGNVIPVPCVEQWNIQSKYLFFLCRSQYTTMEILAQACWNALETAKSRHLQSIAFPPITSHQKKDLLAKAMMDVIKDFNDKNQGLLSVTIVVKKDDPIYKPFLQIMESNFLSRWECKESAM